MGHTKPKGSNVKSNIKNFFKKYIEVNEQSLVAKTDLSLIIDKNEHDEITDNGLQYTINGIFTLCHNQDDCAETPFLFKVNIPKSAKTEETSNEIVFSFKSGDVIASAEYKYIENDIGTIKNIIENRTSYMSDDIVKQLTILLEMFDKSITQTPSVYLEIILSELARDPKDLSRPFRLSGLGDYSKAKKVNIKKAIHYRADLIRNIAHGYTKDGVAQSIVSNSNAKPDAILQAVTGDNEEGEK